jgi:hypothetical protein
VSSAVSDYYNEKQNFCFVFLKFRVQLPAKCSAVMSYSEVIINLSRKLSRSQTKTGLAHPLYIGPNSYNAFDI